MPAATKVNSCLAVKQGLEGWRDRAGWATTRCFVQQWQRHGASAPAKVSEEATHTARHHVRWPAEMRAAKQRVASLGKSKGGLLTASHENLVRAVLIAQLWCVALAWLELDGDLLLVEQVGAFEDDAKGALADLLADAVVDADDVGGAAAGCHCGGRASCSAVGEEESTRTTTKTVSGRSQSRGLGAKQARRRRWTGCGRWSRGVGRGQQHNSSSSSSGRRRGRNGGAAGRPSTLCALRA